MIYSLGNSLAIVYVLLSLSISHLQPPTDSRIFAANVCVLTPITDMSK